MIDKISGNEGLRIADQLRHLDAKTPGAGTAGGAPNFGEVLQGLISDVDQAQKQANVSLEKLATGETQSLQDVVMRMEEADLAFNMMKSIRDKLLAAYKEVMSMQS